MQIDRQIKTSPSFLPLPHFLLALSLVSDSLTRIPPPPSVTPTTQERVKAISCCLFSLGVGHLERQVTIASPSRQSESRLEVYLMQILSDVTRRGTATTNGTEGSVPRVAETNEQLCLAYFVYSVTRQPQARNAHLPLALISILLLFNVFIVLITSTLFHYGHNHQTCPIPHYYISSLPLKYS